MIRPFAVDGVSQETHTDTLVAAVNCRFSTGPGMSANKVTRRDTGEAHELMLLNTVTLKKFLTYVLRHVSIVMVLVAVIII